MIPAPVAVTEPERISSLARYSILDTPPETAFDEIVQLAAKLCNVPVALISLVDEKRQWFKARFGVDVTETPRELSFCAHAILTDDLMVVTDTLDDPRFASNPLVTDEPKIRFYAGAPLKSREGFNLGTLCVIDQRPRVLTNNQRSGLVVLARQVATQLELRRYKSESATLADVDRIRRALITTNHELRTPLTCIRGSLGLLAAGLMGELTSEAKRAIEVAQRNSGRLAAFIDHVASAGELPDAQTPGRPNIDTSSSFELRLRSRPADGMKVLVIDDEEDVRYVARLSLGRVGGMTVIEASSGEEGIARAQSERPDVILLDMMMPGMDGAATFRALRANSDTASIPVIFVTAKALAAEVERLEQLGANGVVLKPFDPLTVARDVVAILSK